MRYSRIEAAGPVTDPDSGWIFVGTSDSVFSAYSPQLRAFVARVTLDGAQVAKPLLYKAAVLVGTTKGKVYAIDKVTLSVLWMLQLDSEVSSPMTQGSGLVYVVSGSSTVYAIDPDNGTIRWSKKRTLPDSVYLKPESKPLFFEVNELRFRKSVVVVGGVLGNVQVLDAATGSFLRDVQVGDSKTPFADVVADPVPYGDGVVAAAYNSGLVIFSPLSGLERWRFPLRGVTRLLISGDMLFAAAKGEIVALSLGRTRNAVRRVWSFAYSQGAVTRLLLHNDRLLFSSSKGGLVELDAKTGRPISLVGSPLGYSVDGDLYGDRVVFLSLSGHLTVWASDSTPKAHRAKSGGFID